MTPKFAIDLNEAEQALAAKIEFDPPWHSLTHEQVMASLDSAAELARRLIERDAIPEKRRQYFTHPEYFPGGRGKSRQNVFEGNGTAGQDILRHPHFLKYLHYFIYGADLPDNILAGFSADVKNCGMVTSSDVVPLGAKARQYARQARLERTFAAEEFFKLSLDLGLGAMTATAIRSSVLQLRSR